MAYSTFNFLVITICLVTFLNNFYVVTADDAWEKHFKKIYPKRIPGPSPKDKIAIVGAGPSGIHMAYLLKTKGFKDVEILEATDDIGMILIEFIDALKLAIMKKTFSHNVHLVESFCD